jgi:methylthioribose-1-phosphate isomerase
VNLKWALTEMAAELAGVGPGQRAARAWALAEALCEAEVAACRAIGEHGAALLAKLAGQRGGQTLNVLTHCNAGWLATVDWGTALAPVYVAREHGIDLHVWVSETRPRNQGASLTAWELAQHGVPHTVVADSAGGHLLQRRRVDLVLTGSDRTTATGDVCNKIGTYPKALAARDNGIPFYVALPHSTIDWSLTDGIAQIPIEERAESELRVVVGRAPSGERAEVAILPDASPVKNFAFDVTPARLVTGLITERGICAASREGLLSLYPERKRSAQRAEGERSP